MAGDGWDGTGEGAVTVFWHVDGTTPDFGAGQRTALINGMQAWANVVQITFQEVAVPNASVSVDWDFLVGDHSATEPQEAGDPQCPFDGAGGVLAHAGFPPGVNSTCINPMPESFAGNVHFDEAEGWEQDNASGAGPFSVTLTACHEVGHGIGLTHSGGADVMRPSQNSTDGFVGLTANDVANIQAGYAAGAGAVITLNATGVWVDGAFGGTELGIPGQPVNTVNEGVAGVPPFTTGVAVHIQAGSYPETVTINRNMILQGENGVVTIGL